MDTTELTKAFGAFFAVMNPFLTLPPFLALTESYDTAAQRKLAKKVTLYSTIMCAVIALAGQSIIGFFGITIDEFRIAGGAVLVQIAWSMLNGQSVSSHQGTADEKKQTVELSSLAFYPITFPMIVGPGTMATLIIYAGQIQSARGALTIGGIVALMLLMMFVALHFASDIGKVLSNTMRVISTRLMGMILLAIAVDMITTGIKTVLPGLG
ncbi:MAG: MarC family protein [Polyangiales bacterium]